MIPPNQKLFYIFNFNNDNHYQLLYINLRKIKCLPTFKKRLTLVKISKIKWGKQKNLQRKFYVGFLENDHLFILYYFKSLTSFNTLSNSSPAWLSVSAFNGDTFTPASII